VAFQEEQIVARIRRSWFTLTFALIALFLAAAILSYVSNRVVEQWVLYAAYFVSAVLALFFWLIPTIRHLNFYVEITTSRLIVRDGIFGQKTTEVAIAEINSVDLGRGRKLTLGRRNGEPLVFERMPKAKLIAEELRSLARLDSGLSA
jgi:membrane protein YdbS with pleckstrin-like domain